MNGQLLAGRYQIEHLLGAGGFGQTFIAKDRQMFDAICVVKLLKSPANDPQTLELARRMFATEARLLHELGHHDRIPRLFASFEEDQNFYLVQEHITGHPLSQELTIDRQLSETEVVHLINDILEPLAYVHQHNIIHRDIKPANLMRRSTDGKIVLIDFGSVKQIQTQSKLTVVIGTYGYMPTEQSAGRPELSSDLFAVGMIALQALTGIIPLEFPIDGELEISWQHIVSITPEFAEFINKMIRYDFRQRYRSAVEALAAIKSIITPISPSNSKTVISKPELSIDHLSSPKLIYLNSKQIRETNSKVILSVSIGTDKSTAAIYQDGQILSLVNIPSAIAYTHDGKCLVGSQAIEQNSWFEKFIYLIGASNDELLNLITQVPYKIAKGTEQQIILYCSALNKWFTAEELLIELLCEILNRCNDHLDSHIDRIILTIPPFLDNIFCREIIKNSAKLAGIEIVRIWNETLSYGVASAFLSGHLGASHNTYLIIAADDFCIDCCLLEIGDGVVEVLGNFLQYPDFGELTKSTGDRLVIGAMEKVLQWSNITNIDALVIPIDLAKLSAMRAINDPRLVDRAKEIIWARNIAAYGTTLEAATLMRKLKNFLVLNTTTLALGIKTKKGIVKIVSECTTIPTLKKVSFLWHGDSGQIVIPIVELKGREDRILGYIYLDVVTIKQSSIVEITFDLDANHILTVMAVDKTSNNPKSLTVTSQTLLTQTATWFSDDRLLDQEAET